MRQGKLFPRLAVHMVQVSEEAGQLEPKRGQVHLILLSR
jgi:type II secretory pathway component PulF